MLRKNSGNETARKAAVHLTAGSVQWPSRGLGHCPLLSTTASHMFGPFYYDQSLDLRVSDGWILSFLLRYGVNFDKVAQNLFLWINLPWLCPLQAGFSLPVSSVWSPCFVRHCGSFLDVEQTSHVPTVCVLQILSPRLLLVLCLFKMLFLMFANF